MNALTVHLQLQSALLITQLGGGDPNSGVGCRYIPGSTLRGALIARYLAGKSADAADPTFRRLFLTGAVCFLNGYPVARDGQRMAPIPFSWQQPKDARKSDPAYDWAWGKPAVNVNAWKGLGDAAFCAVTTAGKVERVTPEMQINIHIAREDRQRPTSGQATVFRYDALAAGQTFAAVILAEDAQDLATMQALLPDQTVLAMGRSRSAGYGWVKVLYPRDQAGQPQTAFVPQWHEVRPAAASASAPSQLIVTLLSDVLVQDPQTGAQAADLRPVVAAEPREAFVRLHKVGGFNRKWNLPMPQTEAMAAGSVFVYPYSQLLAQQLNRFVEEGVGQRRAEGFGRIAVNWQAMTQIEFAEVEKARVGSAPVVGASQPLAQQMVTRMLRVELDRCLLQAINDYQRQLDRRGLRNAQLARVRMVVREAMTPEALQAAGAAKQITKLVSFLDNLKESARQQLQRARLQGSPLFDWLRERAVAPDEIWVLMQANILRLPALGNVRAALTTALAVEYTLRLIDGIAQLSTREESHD